MPHLRDVTTTSHDPFAPVRGPDRPPRHGQPWTDEDYEHLVALVREGHDSPQIADALGRREGALAQRLRALLPPDQRACLADRVLPALRAAVRERPDYPWAEVMLTFPPPAPVVRHVVERAGIGGLEDDLLVEVAWAMLHCESTPDADAARGLRRGVPHADWRGSSPTGWPQRCCAGSRP